MKTKKTNVENNEAHRICFCFARAERRNMWVALGPARIGFGFPDDAPLLGIPIGLS